MIQTVKKSSVLERHHKLSGDSVVDPVADLGQKDLECVLLTKMQIRLWSAPRSTTAI